MRRQRIADLIRQPGNDVDDARRQGAREERDRLNDGQRRRLRRLDDDGVSPEQRRHHLHERQIRGRIPGHDRYDDAVRMIRQGRVPAGQRNVAHVVQCRGVLQRHAHPFGQAAQFAARFRERLAVFANVERDALFEPLAERVESAGEERGAFPRRARGPVWLRRLRACDGAPNVVRRSAHDRPHDVVGSRRIAHLDARGAVNPLAADQQTGLDRRGVFGVR